MRISAAFAIAAAVGATPKETHGSVHLNPLYTTTLVKFIDAHDK